MNGLYLDASVRFYEFADTVDQGNSRTQLAPRTIDSYKFYLKRFESTIGHIRLVINFSLTILLSSITSLADENIRADVKYKSATDLASVTEGQTLDQTTDC